MTIFALFFCMQVTGSCRMVGEARMTFAGPLPAQTYNTLAECQKMGALMSHRTEPTDDGRFPVDTSMWYECRSKHVETWEPAQ